MGMMKVRLRDESHVTNVDKMLAGTKAFIGRKPKRVVPSSCSMCGAPMAEDKPKCDKWFGQIECAGLPKIEFAATGETEEVSDHADHMMALRDGHLELVTADKKKSKE